MFWQNAAGGFLVALALSLAVSAEAQSGSQPKALDKPVLAAESSSRPEGKKDKKADTTALSKHSRPVLSSAEQLAYRIGVEDELQISVWREAEVSSVVVVRPDGMITLPLLNDVKAAGLKTEELQALLTEKFKGFVNDPQVTVIVRAIRSRKVYLVGETFRQGAFAINGNKTVLELLAEAGGLGPFAKGNSIYILRQEGGKKVRIPFHYRKALEGTGENITLLPGDLVVVP